MGSHASPPQNDSRRSFLSFLTNALGALFGVFLGAPAVGYLLDPLGRARGAGAMKPASGVRLDQLETNRPVQGVINDVRQDAWTLHPSDVVGRVWVVKQVEGPLNSQTLASASQAERDRQVLVLTTICPHLGCSVNLRNDCFGCPCHAAEFGFNGDRRSSAGHRNPALRGMDTLEWNVNLADPQGIVVAYKNFKGAEAEKIVVG